jgi:hypothetical protein
MNEGKPTMALALAVMIVIVIGNILLMVAVLYYGTRGDIPGKHQVPVDESPAAQAMQARAVAYQAAIGPGQDAGATEPPA